ncbi:MAG: NAD(+) synthase, partial [Thermoanaerobacteraceae bacterium]|nr:NAD(+) synthase [Thermoanaerobacteraceae bacterium]
MVRFTPSRAIVGLPFSVSDKLYNCAAVLHRGKLLGIVPKIFLPDYKGLDEKRWFVSGSEICNDLYEIKFIDHTVPFGKLLFRNDQYDITMGVEIAEDLCSIIPPSSYLALRGANIIANPSASSESVGKAQYRKKLVEQQSARCNCGYIYAEAGVFESTTDMVFGGHCLIAENGVILKESERFQRKSSIIYSEIDIERLAHERRSNLNLSGDYKYDLDKKYRIIEFNFIKNFVISSNNLERNIEQHPFIPSDPFTRNECCKEIFHIQTASLAKRLEHTGSRKAVIGISGGLDSTLALLVTAKTFDLLGISRKNIEAVTMPGFGTTDLTYTNAMKLMKALNVSVREIDIKPACLQHMKDLGLDPNEHDITYENLQARERTQILMDLANKIGGLVVGTGDLSELALGWATYNGDHMSMYSVNCGVPKTLVKIMVKWVADNLSDDITKKILYNIIDTPISPELLPPDKHGSISQKTEDTLGPYELHDFFLFYSVGYGMTPKKILFLANTAFKGKYDSDTIKKWLKYFYKRFF